MNNELQVIKPQPTAANMLQAVIEKGVTADNVAAIEKLTELMWKTQEREAEQEFSKSFAAFQSEITGKIHTTKAISNRDGSARSTYAPLEDLMDQLKPYLCKHGLSVSFSEPNDVPAGKIARVCIVRHVGGFKHEARSTMRVGSGPMGCNETQSDGSAITYAKRYALCDALGISIDKDTDARSEGNGAFVTEQQADELERRVKETNSNVAAFLKLAGAAKFSEIPVSKYATLDEALRRKESQGR